MGVNVLSASTSLTNIDSSAVSESEGSIDNESDDSVDNESGGSANDDDGSCWQINFLLQNAVGDLTSNVELQTNFRQLFVAVIEGQVENDGFNRLISKAEMSISELVLLRAVAKYLSQIKVPFSQMYMAETLTKYSEIASSIVALFSTKFAPASDDQQSLTDIQQRQSDIKLREKTVLEQLEQVVSRDEDRILRSYLSILNAMLRTNFLPVKRLLSATKRA